MASTDEWPADTPTPRDEGAGLSAPAAAAKEEQLAQHCEPRYQPNAFAVTPGALPLPDWVDLPDLVDLGAVERAESARCACAVPVNAHAPNAAVTAREAKARADILIAPILGRFEVPRQTTKKGGVRVDSPFFRVSQRGGGEIRTPVLHKIFRSVYVRIPPIDVSSSWPAGRPPLDEPSRDSRAGGGRANSLAQICVT